MLCYKYRDFSDRTLDILASKKLYFARAEELNDPLDSQIDISLEYQRAQKELYKLDSDSQMKKSFLLYLLNSKSLSEKDTGKKIQLNEALQIWMRQLGILSLSKNPCDALLWSHYAAGHTGICFGFNVDEMGISKKLKSKEVEYVVSPRYKELFLRLIDELGAFVRPWEESNSYPNELGDKFYTKQISLITDENLLVKSEKWSYEEEFRVVTANYGLHDFEPISLKNIVIGTKTRPQDIKKLQRMLRKPEWHHVVQKQVKNIPGSFSFELVDFHGK